MMKLKLNRVICVALFSIGLASSAEAQLTSRLAGQAVYDADRDITWIADTNLALTNQFGLALSGIEFDSAPNTVGSTGLMTWDNANVWIAGMNAANYLGFNDWRLPTTADTDASCTDDAAGTIPGSGVSMGFNCTGSEMGHLVYDELGGTPGSDLILTANPVELAKFTNLVPGVSHSVWSTAYLPSPIVFAWTLEFLNGQQGSSAKVNSLFVIAVRSGDVGVAAPVPASGLSGLITLTIGLLASGLVVMTGRGSVLGLPTHGDVGSAVTPE